MALTIRTTRAAVFHDEASALATLTALYSALAAVAPMRRLWTRFRGQLLELDQAVLELLLREERSIRADLPDFPTHVLRLAAKMSGAGEVGVITVTVRAEAPPGGPAGLDLTADLTADVGDTQALSCLLERCIEAVSADLAMIGPEAWLEELGVGWATFARRVRRELLPAGAAVIAMKGGSLVIAHTEEPGSESAAAREAVLRVREALHGGAVAAPLREVMTDPVAVPAEARAPAFVIAAAQPTYLTPAPRPAEQLAPADPPRPPVLRAPERLGGTSLAVDFPRGPDLPFVPGASVELSRPPVLRAPERLGGTSLAVEVPRGPDLPFGVSASGEPSGLMALALPELTLEQYALLRARLSVEGEDAPQVWSQFGVTSRAVKEALQARFAARFRHDPAAQAHFVELVQRFVSDLRAQRRTV